MSSIANFQRTGRCAVAILLAALSVPASAQTVVRPGTVSPEIDRQLQRLNRSLQRQPVTEGVVTAPERAKEVPLKPGGPQFKLNKVIFGQSNFISAAELQRIAKRFVGRDVDFARLQNLVAAVNTIYAAKGISSALAVLPPQQVKDGIVRVKLTEGRVGRVDVVGAAYTSPDFIKDRIPLKQGSVVDPPALQREIIRFNRVNDIQVRAVLQPGSGFGLSDIQFAAVEPQQNYVQLFADNQGVESTGYYQFGGYFRRYGIFGYDDRMVLYATYAGETLNANVSYNVPVGYSGTRIGVSYAQSESTIIDGPFKILDVTSQSKEGALNLTHPFFVDAIRLFQGTMSISFGQSASKHTGQLVTDDDTIKLTAGLSIDYRGDTYEWRVAPAVKFVHINGRILDRSEDFVLFVGTGYAAIRPRPDLNFAMTLGWQLTADKLVDGASLYQIGGPTTVRGHATNAVAGDQGYYASFEAHRTWTDAAAGLDTFAFVDVGTVFSTFPSHRTIASVGLGATWQLHKEVGFELSGAVPIVEKNTGDDFTIYGRLILRPQF